MKFSDLLDELRNNILNDRGASTGDDDKLWSDRTLTRYINEAQRRFAKRAYVLWDSSTAEVVNVTLVEGVTQYDLHPAILSVVSAKISDANYDLVRVGHRILGDVSSVSNDVPFDPNLLSSSTPGAPRAFATDETLAEDDEGTLAALSMRVWPTPRAEDAGTVIKLRTVRMPLEDLKNSEDVPEIPVDHHMEMLDWAAHLALRIVDQDAGNPKRAADFAASFESHVQEAKKLVLRKIKQPQGVKFARSWQWGS